MLCFFTSPAILLRAALCIWFRKSGMARGDSASVIVVPRVCVYPCIMARGDSASVIVVPRVCVCTHVSKIFLLYGIKGGGGGGGRTSLLLTCNHTHYTVFCHTNTRYPEWMIKFNPPGIKHVVLITIMPLSIPIRSNAYKVVRRVGRGEPKCLNFLYKPGLFRETPLH